MSFRPSGLVKLLPLFALAIILCTVHVSPGQEGVYTRGLRTGETVPAGWHLRWPFVERLVRFPAEPFVCEGEATEVTREGASRIRQWRVNVLVRSDAAVRFARALENRRPCPGIMDGVAQALGSGADSPREAIRATLGGMGLETRELWLNNTDQRQTGREVPSPAGKRRPVLLVGLDGADWLVLEPLMQAGMTPNLARLKREGAWTALRSNNPMLSPLLWTTVATGRPPEEHGIVDFLIRDPATGARVPISSNFRRAKALWNILSDAGIASDWIAWWATWPAERIMGHMVTDRVAYSLFGYEAGPEDTIGATWPADYLKQIQAHRVTDHQITLEEMQRFVRVDAKELEASRRRAARSAPHKAYSDPLMHLTRILASTATYHRTALELLENGQAPLTAVYYQGIDEVSHRFAHCTPPRMSLCSDADFVRYRDTLFNFYSYQDSLIGELLERVDPDTVVIVLSDHGFLSGSERPTNQPPHIEGRPGEWHRAYGLFVMHGREIPAGRTETVTLYDLAPTLLHLLGLPAGEDMRGEVLAAARAGLPSEVKRIASWEEVGPRAAPAGAAPSSSYDEDVIARLRSLGYIQGPDEEEEDTPATRRVEQSGQPPAPADAGSVTYHTNLGVLYQNRGEHSRAEIEFRRALEIRANHPDALGGLATVLLDQHRSAEARSLLEPFLERSAEANSRIWLLYTAACSQDGRLREGLRFLERQAARRAVGCRLEVARARLMLDLQDPAGSENALKRGLENEPGCITAIEDLFDLYETTRQLDLQDGLMLTALRTRPDSPRLLGLESLRLKARSDMRGAEETLQRALSLAPDDPMLLTNFGSLLGISGRYRQAIDLLKDVVRRNPWLLEARVNLGAALGKQGHVREAIEVFEEARTLGISSTTLLNALAVAYAENRQQNEAIHTLEDSLQIDGDQPMVQAMLTELRRTS